MLYNEVMVNVKVEADTPFRMKDKLQLLKSISELQAEDQHRIIEICKNPKALKAISEHWETLQPMFK